MVDEQGSLSWGQTIETMRRLREWTQARLAGEAGISVSSLSEYERGNLEPPEDVQARIEEALGLGGWTPIAQAILGQMRTAAEGGREGSGAEGVLGEAARAAAERTEVALRAGLERLRQVREGGRSEEEPGPTRTAGL